MFVIVSQHFTVDQLQKVRYIHCTCVMYNMCGISTENMHFCWGEATFETSLLHVHVHSNVIDFNPLYGPGLGVHMYMYMHYKFFQLSTGLN